MHSCCRFHTASCHRATTKSTLHFQKWAFRSRSTFCAQPVSLHERCRCRSIVRPLRVLWRSHCTCVIPDVTCVCVCVCYIVSKIFPALGSYLPILLYSIKCTYPYRNKQISTASSFSCNKTYNTLWTTCYGIYWNRDFVVLPLAPCVGITLLYFYFPLKSNTAFFRIISTVRVFLLAYSQAYKARQRMASLSYNWFPIALNKMRRDHFFQPIFQPESHWQHWQAYSRI